MTEKGNEVTVMFDFPTEDLSFEDFFDGCKRAARAFGFGERIIMQAFENIDSENDW